MKKYSLMSYRSGNFIQNTLFIKLLLIILGLSLFIWCIRFKIQNEVINKEDLSVAEFVGSEVKDQHNANNFPDKAENNEENEVSESNEQNFSNSPTLIESSTIKQKKLPEVLENERRNPITPVDIQKPLPRPKQCIKNVEEFLMKVRKDQKNLTEYWNRINVNKLNTTPLIKWTALTSTYEPGHIDFKFLYHFVTDGENKYFMDFVERNESDCNIWTLGVGLDYAGEVKLWNRYPQCKMTAVDPMSEVNKDIVERVPNSRFIEATIGAKDGTYLARLRRLDKKYETVTVEHVGLTNFLRQHNVDKLIDLLIMDIEGAEFGVLPMLIEEKHLLPTICQFNVELHYAPENYGYDGNKALQGLYKLLSDGTYSIFNMEVLKRLIRVYAVNTQNPECIKKFFC